MKNALSRGLALAAMLLIPLVCLAANQQHNIYKGTARADPRPNRALP